MKESNNNKKNGIDTRVVNRSTKEIDLVEKIQERLTNGESICINLEFKSISATKEFAESRGLSVNDPDDLIDDDDTIGLGLGVSVQGNGAMLALLLKSVFEQSPPLFELFKSVTDLHAEQSKTSSLQDKLMELMAHIHDAPNDGGSGDSDSDDPIQNLLNRK